MNGFRKLPTGWVRGNKLTNFHGGSQTGESISALKVLLGITLFNDDFHKNEVEISYSKLEEICCLSNPSISSGIKKLEKEGIIRVDRSGNTNKYSFTNCVDNRWSKVPFKIVCEKLKNLSNRSPSTLGALKIYITLLTIRENSSEHVRISYEKLRSWTGLQSVHIRPGLDILFSHSIIHIQKSEELDVEEVTHPHNVYKIMGNLILKR